LEKDIQHYPFPLGVDGKSRELNLVFPMMIFKYSKFPNAAKAYLAFMMEREQYVPWQEASIGYVCHPLAAYESSAFWTADRRRPRIATA
jgi:multiple sugar transport system substrate-binding protein